MISSPTSPPFRTLDGLTKKFRGHETALDKARTAIQEAAIRHLRERNARPGKVADHTPWDRVWIGELARKAGVPPVKGPNAVGPAPTYDPDVQAAALAELDKLTAPYTRAEAGLAELTEPIYEEIRRLYQEGFTPSEIAPHTPYDANWVGEIGRGTAKPGKPRESGRVASARRTSSRSSPAK
ncbi:hypothetical protein ACF09H_29730 [Streptomyces sp. NPDC014983]|uniref:hypothetical protein n=1 Tax=Streptomyces sp. NPDC014983 TaxID=3364933 RepID=UPI0036F8B2DE